MRWIALLVMLGSGASALAQAGPSFDCVKAGTEVEKTLCADGNGTLGEMDGALGRLYAEMKRQGSFDKLLAGQSAWLKERNACKDDVECLTKAYVMRLMELSNAAGDAHGVSGRYGYSRGETDNGEAWLVRDANGTLSGGIDSVASSAAHTCSVAFTDAKEIGNTWLWEAPADADAACRILFRPEGLTLRIDSRDCQYYCGARGYFDETYKRQ